MDNSGDIKFYLSKFYTKGFVCLLWTMTIVFIGDSMRFLNKLGDDEIIKLALLCGMPENFPSIEMEQNGMRVLRFDKQITIISKNEGKKGQASYECSMLSLNDYEVLKSDLANKGTEITPKQNEELVKFMTQKFGKQYVYWCKRYWHQKEVIRRAETELEMI